MDLSSKMLEYIYPILNLFQQRMSNLGIVGKLDNKLA